MYHEGLASNHAAVFYKCESPFWTAVRVNLIYYY